MAEYSTFKIVVVAVADAIVMVESGGLQKGTESEPRDTYRLDNSRKGRRVGR